MIRAALITAACALAWAAWSETVTARAAETMRRDFSRDVTRDGRGGDHLWEVAIDFVAPIVGRAPTAGEALAYAALMAQVEREIAAGRASDRLRSLRR